MFFDDFKSKFFGQTKKSKNPMNNNYYYDSNGVIKGFEEVIEMERNILQTIKNYNEKYQKTKDEKARLSPEFHLLYERMNRIEYDMQKKVIHLQEDFVYIMKNAVALEKEIISMIESIRNHPKFNKDDKLWKEVTDVYLPKFRSLFHIIDKYTEKHQTDLEKDT